MAKIGPLSLSFSRTDHPPVTFAVRVEGAGRVLGYSADTGPEWSFKAFGPEIDLALCEATYTQEHEGTAGHMSGRQAGQSAREAGVHRLIITHHSPVVSPEAVYLEALTAFGRPVERAAVGRGTRYEHFDHTRPENTSSGRPQAGRTPTRTFERDFTVFAADRCS